ncbi:hypothetical protein CBR_g40153 [Chara braunii]|uniref:Reverse transcriptase zinc-binding domain-containing protein n=1 Tax=Chara braunii TaxID=69332 RepID=A0A388LT64_CHABU|nr:hypothetical protein CBR_g40153 [Chara braunii]|eukprot:GBG85514.1 hypothetical protein CBR_g40153 [Chara braunii]
MMAPRRVGVAFLLLALMSGLWLVVVSAAPTPEQQLLAAILNPRVTKFTLKSDVLLTASLPDITRRFAVVGKCPRGRRCVIDGQKKYRAFWTEEYVVISLSKLHFKNLRTPSASDNVPSNRTFGVTSGAAAFAYNGVIRATDCVFENNAAEVGGAIGVRDARIIAKNCAFRDNKASGNGGAIKVASNGGAYVSGSQFVGNTAGGLGGAVHGYEGGLYFSQCKFQSNKADGAEGGGAIFFSYIGGDVWKSEFTGNSAPNGSGGAVGIDDPSLGDIDFCHCTFKGNTAKTPGSENVNIVPSDFLANVDNGVCPDDASLGEVVEGPDGKRFVVNGQVNAVKDAWLKDHTVIVTFQGEAINLSRQVKEDLIRAYGDGWFAKRIFGLDAERGRVKFEGANVVSYVARSEQIATWLLQQKELRIKLQESEEYIVSFKPWLPLQELREVRLQEAEMKFWIMALRVPLDAYYYLRSAVQGIFGDVLHMHPPEFDSTRPKLMKVKLDMPPEVRDKVEDMLVIEGPTGEMWRVEIATPYTDWCRFYLLLQSPSQQAEDNPTPFRLPAGVGSSAAQLSIVREVSESVWKAVKRLVARFIWKPNAKEGEGFLVKVAWELLTFPRCEGGLNLVDPAKKNQAQLSLWVAKVASALVKEHWIELAEQILMREWGLSRAQDVWCCLFIPSFQRKRVKSRFWKEVLKAWSNLPPDTSTKPQTKEEVQTQLLFENPQIVDKGGNQFEADALAGSFGLAWIRKGIVTIGDLWNHLLGSWRRLEDVQEILIPLRNIEPHLQQILEAIPIEWRELLGPEGIDPVGTWYCANGEDADEVWEMLEILPSGFRRVRRWKCQRTSNELVASNEEIIKTWSNPPQARIVGKGGTVEERKKWTWVGHSPLRKLCIDPAAWSWATEDVKQPQLPLSDYSVAKGYNMRLKTGNRRSPAQVAISRWQAVISEDLSEAGPSFQALWESLTYLPNGKQVAILWQMSLVVTPSAVWLVSRGMQVELKCPRCNWPFESTRHLWWECPASRRVWKWWKLHWQRFGDPVVDWEEKWVLLGFLPAGVHRNRGWPYIAQVVRGLLCEIIWKDRNRARFERRPFSDVEIKKAVRQGLREAIRVDWRKRAKAGKIHDPAVPLERRVVL